MRVVWRGCFAICFAVLLIRLSSSLCTVQQTWMEFPFSSKNRLFFVVFNYYFQFIIIVIICYSSSTLLTSMNTVCFHRRSTVNFSFDVCVRNNHIFSFVCFWNFCFDLKENHDQMSMGFCRRVKNHFSCYFDGFFFVFVFARWIIDGSR